MGQGQCWPKAPMGPTSRPQKNNWPYPALVPTGPDFLSHPGCRGGAQLRQRRCGWQTKRTKAPLYTHTEKQSLSYPLMRWASCLSLMHIHNIQIYAVISTAPYVWAFDGCLGLWDAPSPSFPSPAHRLQPLQRHSYIIDIGRFFHYTRFSICSGIACSSLTIDDFSPHFLLSIQIRYIV